LRVCIKRSPEKPTDSDEISKVLFYRGGLKGRKHLTTASIKKRGPSEETVKVALETVEESPPGKGLDDLENA